jgi:hypothetical protein
MGKFEEKTPSRGNVSNGLDGNDPRRYLSNLWQTTDFNGKN